MSNDSYHKDRRGNRKLHPETLMLGYGYDPALSEGALKPPVFLTSTFVFTSAEHGKEFFDYVAGRREPPKGEKETGVSGSAEERHVAVEDALDQARRALASKPA